MCCHVCVGSKQSAVCYWAVMSHVEDCLIKERKQETKWYYLQLFFCKWFDCFQLDGELSLLCLKYLNIDIRTALPCFKRYVLQNCSKISWTKKCFCGPNVWENRWILLIFHQLQQSWDWTLSHGMSNLGEWFSSWAVIHSISVGLRDGAPSAHWQKSRREDYAEYSRTHDNFIHSGGEIEN